MSKQTQTRRGRLFGYASRQPKLDPTRRVRLVSLGVYDGRQLRETPGFPF